MASHAIPTKGVTDREDRRDAGARCFPKVAELPTIAEIVVADAPESWQAVGFSVEEGVARVGSVPIRLAGPDASKGIVEWALRGVSTLELDGLPTTSSAAPPVSGARHPNGVERIDHVVAFSPTLERTVPALEAAGLPLRRLREGPTPGGAMRQAFFRLGEVILEVIEQPPETAMADRPARLWGLAFVVEDIDAALAELGDQAGPIRPAVEPGRRIAPLRRSAGLAIPIAFMTS